MNKPVVLSLGEVLWDLFPDGERFGGAPANFACHAALLGADVAMISAVGDDRRGRDALDLLKTYQVDVSLVQTVPHAPTGQVSVALDGAGKPTFTIHAGSAWDRLTYSDALAARAASAQAVYFGTLGQRGAASQDAIRRIVSAAQRAGVPRLLDVNLRAPFYDDAMIRESIQLASLLKLSDDELPAVCQACGVASADAAEATLRRLRESQHLDLVVMTRGADGAMLVTADETVEQPGVPTVVRDTVGAGDAFTAAFLLGWLRQTPAAQNLLHACTVAAAVCSHPGAVPAPSTSSSNTR